MENKTVNIDIDRVCELLPDYPADDSNLLTVEEFATLIEEHPRTVYRCIKSGKVPDRYNIFFKELPYYEIYKSREGMKGGKIVRILANNLRDDIRYEASKIISKRDKEGGNEVKIECRVSMFIREKLKFLAAIKGTTVNNLVNTAIEKQIRSEENNNLSRETPDRNP